jgi:hypothetical protein
MAPVHLTGYRNKVTSTVGSFVANMPELLGSMAVDPRCLVAVAEFSDVRYVQFWVEPGGTVIAEVISNLNIGDAVALTDEDEGALRAMGWCEPSPGPNPNWRYESHDVTGLIRIVSMTRRAIFEVLGERPSNLVHLQSWAMEPDEALSSDVVREVSRVHFQDALRQIARELDE